MSHPYASLPDHCFWRKAISTVPAAEVDPVVRGKFRVRKTDRVSTAGSCFAQHIARHLSKAGFNYFVTETVNPFITPGMAQGCSTLSTDAPLQKGIKALQSRGVSVLTEGTSLVST